MARTEHFELGCSGFTMGQNVWFTSDSKICQNSTKRRQGFLHRNEWEVEPNILLQAQMLAQRGQEMLGSDAAAAQWLRTFDIVDDDDVAVGHETLSSARIFQSPDVQQSDTEQCQ